MSWNYRIIRHSVKEDCYYSLHEVYYDDDGNPNGYTEKPASFTAHSDEGYQAIAKSLKAALEDAERLPVLRVEEFDKDNTEENQ